MMQENEFLFNRQRVWGKAKYIIVVQREMAENAAGSWEGRLAAIKRTVDERSKQLHAQGVKLEQRFEMMEDRMKMMQDKMLTKFSNVDGSIRTVLSAINDVKRSTREMKTNNAGGKKSGNM